MVTDRDRFCAILLAMGGPETTNEIPEYLYNIFSDRAIIRLPGGSLFQKPFAKMISSMRTTKVQHHYEQIGGGSPLSKWTTAQRDMIEKIIQEREPAFRCFIGMRYTRPSIAGAVADAIRAGFRSICFLPLYPQFSRATTGSSFEVANQAVKQAAGVTASFIRDFHDDQGYIALMQKYIAENIENDETLLFSAHSLPQKFVDEGDPYVEQVRRTARLAAGSRQYFLSFQSRTGPVKWVGPDTIDEARRLLNDRQGGLFIVPISFVCDHIETLYEIDIQLKELVAEKDRGRIRRMPMFNDDLQFAQVLARLTLTKVHAHASI